MKVLVVEDKRKHRDAVAQTLQDHEVTVVSSFDEAMDMMSQKIDKENVERLMAEAGFSEMPSKEKDGDAYDDRRKEYWEMSRKARKESLIPFPFEAVLSDMMMPMSQKTLGPGIWNPREEVPYGFIIALRAAQCGAKFVAVVTDTNHHKGAMSAALDHLSGANYSTVPDFEINGAKGMFVHAPFLGETFPGSPCDECTDGVCTTCNGSLQTTNYKGEEDVCWRCKEHPGKCHQCKGTGEYEKKVWEKKNWGQVLKDLTADEVEKED